ncbi:DUF4476 domain-containing protein [Myxococcaceae bacterium JPH2]|nr:DUF4476 domain-containing protein [Myxococcaceae bacterium JPH2]
MKALTLAVVMLTSAAALAQQAPTVATGTPAAKATAPAAPATAAAKAAAPAATAAQPQGFGPDAELMRRPPPPGRPMPDSPDYREGETERYRGRGLVVVDRDAVGRKLARLEELLDDAMDRRDGQSARKALRRAQDELEELQEMISDAPPLGSNGPPRPTPPSPPVVQPMPDGAFQRLTSAMSREAFAEDKMRILTSATSREHFVVAQVLQVLNQFSFSQDKLEVVRAMKPGLLDMQNSYQLYNAFTFSPDKKRLQEILNN